MSNINEYIENEYDGILDLNENDYLFFSQVEKCRKYLNEYEDNRTIGNVNEAIEMYVIYKVSSEKNSVKELFDEYDEKIKAIIGRVAKYFSEIDSNNIVPLYSEVCFSYKDCFWEMFEKFKVYNKVSQEAMYRLLDNPGFSLYRILSRKKIVDYYDEVLSNILKQSEQTAEILITQFMKKHEKGFKRYFLPKSLDPSDFNIIIRRYIESNHPNINRLQLISRFISTDECPIDERTKLEAKKKCQEKMNDPLYNRIDFKFSVGISFRDIPEIMEVDTQKPGEYSFIYDAKWIRNNTDYPTLLNNFIYLFQFVDVFYRCNLPAVESNVGSIERTIGIKGKNDYIGGSSFQFIDRQSDLQMYAYRRELASLNIRIEDAFKWFFSDYLKNEFGVEGYIYNSSTENSSPLEKCKNTISELDAVNKQFNLFVEDKNINRELLEMTSKPILFQDVKSLIPNKYAYVASEELNKESYFLFSDQSMICYINGYEGREDSFYDIAKNNKISISKLNKVQLDIVCWLKERGTLTIDNGIIELNMYRTFILKELYEKGVICPRYYSGIKLLENYNDLLDKGELVTKSTLFSKPEQDYLNYKLNRKEFSDGGDLRNRYIHGTYCNDKNIQERDYNTILKILTIVILKINEELGVRTKSWTL